MCLNYWAACEQAMIDAFRRKFEMQHLSCKSVTVLIDAPPFPEKETLQPRACKKPSSKQYTLTHIRDLTVV